MARLIRAATARRALLSPPPRIFSKHGEGPHLSHAQSEAATWHTVSKCYSTKSPIDSNILRILKNEIDYQSELSPPHQAASEFNSFVVQDRPGEQWMTMRRRFNGNEEVMIEATMFDGYETVPNPEYNLSEGDVRLHISVLVDVRKDSDENALEFVCSAWPDCLEIQKVYFLRQCRGRPYMGPDFRKLNSEIQKGLRVFLDKRGVNSDLSFFLHNFMMNKDRVELIRWFEKVKSFVEK